MTQPRNSQFKIQKIGYGGLLIAVLLLAAVTLALSADDEKVKVGTIDATAMGTSTQLGQTVNVKVNIYQFSTDEDRAILVEAYKKGQNQGLVNALTKMKADGHIAITGTIGYDLSFIRLIPTPTGRKIRFVTNRLLRFGEAYYDTQSKQYNLTAGEIDINDSDKKQKQWRSLSGCPARNQQRRPTGDPATPEPLEARQHYRLEQGRYPPRVEHRRFAAISHSYGVRCRMKVYRYPAAGCLSVCFVASPGWLHHWSRHHQEENQK